MTLGWDWNWVVVGFQIGLGFMGAKSLWDWSAWLEMQWREGRREKIRQEIADREYRQFLEERTRATDH